MFKIKSLAQKLSPFVLTVIIATGTTQSNAEVDLKPYGLSDVAGTASCVLQRMPSTTTEIVAFKYWQPRTMVNGSCGQAANKLTAFDSGAAKRAFLNGLSDCLGRRVIDDYGFQTQRIADAVSVLSAGAIRDNMSGKTLLETLDEGSNACNPKPQK